jgi:hypothetical protein
MNKFYWRVFVLMVGFLIFGVSLQRALVMGALDKIGVEHAGTDELFEKKGIEKAIAQGDLWECKTNLIPWEALRFWAGNSEQRIKSGWEIGRRRLGCGASQAVHGSSPQALYQIVRGLTYWEKSLILMEEEGYSCELLPDSDYLQQVTTLRMLAKGRAQIVLSEIEMRLLERYSSMHKRCIDQ